MIASGHTLTVNKEGCRWVLLDGPKLPSKSLYIAMTHLGIVLECAQPRIGAKTIGNVLIRTAIPDFGRLP